jgi:hypothetical protein
MTEQQVRRSFVNCSRGEAQGLALPRGFADLDWSELDLLGRRDPKAPLRGSVVLDVAEGCSDRRPALMCGPGRSPGT